MVKSWLTSTTPAHRLIGRTDNLGNSIVITPDLNGNVLHRDVYDATSTLTASQGFTYDEQNRLYHLMDVKDGADVLNTEFDYDGNGNRTFASNPIGRATSFVYDGLNRLANKTDPPIFCSVTNCGDGPQGITQYKYDDRDNLLRVTNPNDVATKYTWDGFDGMTQEASPDAGTSNFTPDSAGNVHTRTWANGKSVITTYDALNRPTLQDYGGGTTVSFQYDSVAGGNFGIGHLTQMTDPSGKTTWAYDQLGRLLTKVQTIGVRVLTTSYAYDGFGRLKTMTYPSGHKLAYGYVGGQLDNVLIDGASFLSAITWMPFGPVKSWTQANGAVITRTYALSGALTDITSSAIGQQFHADYDSQWRPATRSFATSGDEKNGIDALDEVTSTSSAYAGASTGGGYSYDYDFNRAWSGDPLGNLTNRYNYVKDTNRLLTITGDKPTQHFTTDRAGNITGDDVHTYGFDARNRLTSVDTTLAQYLIDGKGQRVGKTGSVGTSYVSADEQGHIIGQYDASTALAETVYLGDTPVGALMPAGTYAVDTDQLNVPRGLRNSANALVWAWPANAFGSNPADGDPLHTGVVTTYDLRFPGQLYDKETGLHSNHFREYDPAIGRYLESDPIGLAGGINTYAYVAGNPISTTDPRGLDNPGMGPYDVSVTVYYYGGSTGHIGIGVNGGPSFGFYPTSNSAFGILLGLPASGRLQSDGENQKNGATSAVVLPATVDQAAAVQAGFGSLLSTPPEFEILTQNCTVTAAQLLRNAGFKNIPTTIVPSSFINGFGQP